MTTNTHFWSYLAELFLEWEMIHTEVVEKNTKNTHFMFNSFFFLKSFRKWNNVEKYCRAGQATDDNMAHAQYILDT